MSHLRAVIVLAVVMALSGFLLTDPGPVESSSDFELVLEVGLEDGPEEYVFGGIPHVERGPDGRLYVLERMDPAVRVYDRDGSYLFRFGRGGSGPGEFQLPIRLDLLGDTVRVYDAQQRRVSHFRSDGTHLSTDRLPDPSDHFMMVVLPFGSGRWLGVTSAGSSASGIRRAMAGQPVPGLDVHILVGQGGVVLDTLASHRAGATFWYDAVDGVPFGGVPGGSRFGESGGWALSGDSLVVTVDAVRARVRWHVATGSGVEVRREEALDYGEPRPVTEADLAALEADFRESRTSTPSRLGLLAPEYWAVLGRPILADDGALWITERPAPGASEDALARGTPVLVFPPNEGPPTRLRLPPGFVLHSVREGHIVGTGRTEFDAPIVQVYRMLESTG